MDDRMAVDIAARRAGRAAPGGSAARRSHERELAIRFRRDPGSRDTVLRALLPLARGIARRYWRGDEPLEDLEQVATLGLLKALRSYDPARGTSFASYAIPTMNGELRRHYRDTGWAVHVPRGTQELALRVSRTEREAANRAGRPPTAAELAAELDTSEEAVVEARLAANGMRAGSLDRPARTDHPESEPLAAVFEGREDEGFANAERRATLRRLVEDLSERDRAVLALRFAGDLSQAEIGRRVGVSQMQVSRILRRAMEHLQEAAETAAA
jgi:RNA polymerase sigma-B factor